MLYGAYRLVGGVFAPVRQGLCAYSIGHNLALNRRLNGLFGTGMPGQLRISHLYIVLGVGLAHIFLIFLLSRDKPAVLAVPKMDIIPVLVVSQPPVKENPPSKIIRAEPVKPLPAPTSSRKPHSTKPKVQADRQNREQDKDAEKLDAANQSNTKKAPYAVRRNGAFIVRRRTGTVGAFGIFYRGFDCVRLNPVFNRRYCPSNPVDLMQGQQAKIAAVSARMARIHAGSGRYGKTFGILDRAEPGSSRRPLSTKPPTGAAIIDENFAKIPPKYPDPAFGD